MKACTLIGWAGILLVFGAVGCRHYAHFEVTVPGQKALPGVRNMAVADFENRTQLAHEMNLGNRVAQGFRDGVEREKFIEIRFLPTGSPADPSTAISQAPSGANAVVLGAIEDAAVEDSPPEATMMMQMMYVGDQMQPVQVPAVKIDRLARLAVSYRVLRVPDARILAENVFHQTSQRFSQTALNPDLARAALPAPNYLMFPMVNSIIGTMVKELSPTTAQVERRLLGGDSNVDLGIQSAEHKLWDEAQAYWELAAEQAEKPKHRAAAYYNLAVYYEVHNDFEKARTCLTEARGLNPKESLFMEYLGTISAREQEFQKVVQQREMMDQVAP